MRRMVTGLVAASFLAGTAPAGAQADPFAGEWMMAQRFFPGSVGRLLLFLDAARSGREGDSGHARMLVIDDANAKGIRSNVIDYSFDCKARTYRRVAGTDYDAEGRLVTTGEAGPPAGPITNNSLTGIAFDHACFEETLWLAPVEGPVQAYADEVFAASPGPPREAEDDTL